MALDLHSDVQRNRPSLVPIIIGVGYIFVALVIDPLIAVHLTPLLRVSIALVFGAAFLYGVSIAWGAGAGAAVVALISGPLGAFVGMKYLALIAFATTAATLSRVYAIPQPVPSTVRDWVRYTGIVLSSATAYSAILAWGADILRVGPFSIVVTRSFVHVATSSLVVAPVLIVLLTAGSDGRWSRTESGRVRIATWPVLGTTLVPIAWLGGGYLVSVGFQAIQLEYHRLLVNRLGMTAVTLIQAAGTRGRYALGVFGALAFTMFLVSLVSLRCSLPEHNHRG